MFWIKNKKNRYTLANPSFAIVYKKVKVGFKGVFTAQTWFPDVRQYCLLKSKIFSPQPSTVNVQPFLCYFSLIRSLEPLRQSGKKSVK